MNIHKVGLQRSQLSCGPTKYDHNLTFPVIKVVLILQSQGAAGERKLAIADWANTAFRFSSSACSDLAGDGAVQAGRRDPLLQTLFLRHPLQSQASN